MTEKRFTLAYETNDQYCIWWAVKDGDVSLWKEEVVALLNELNEKNRLLKSRLEFIEAHNKALIHTNDELKKDLLKYDKLLESEYWRGK